MSYYDDMEDAYMDKLSVMEYLLERQAPLPTTWTMKNGTVVNIKDMRPTHLQNTYMLLCRNGKGESLHGQALKRELERRGDLNELHPDDLA